MSRLFAPGWRAVLLGTAAFLVIPSVETPLRSMVPITETWVLVAAALAVCAGLGWWNGGGVQAAVAAAVFGGVALSAPVGVPASAYAELARGWTLLLVAAFGVTSLLSPAQGFFTRALAATGIAVTAALALAAVTPTGIGTVREAMQHEAQRRTDETLASVGQVTSSPAWRDAAARSPDMDAAVSEGARQLAAIPAWTARLLPALLAIESLAALAVAWAVYQRVAAVAPGPPFGPGAVREFRFNDQLIWGLAVGATLCALPALAELRVTGLNLLVFFGTLYLLRGIGVLSWGSRGRWVGVLLIALTIFAPFLLAALALGVGVADTWMDWRGRAQPAA